MASKVTVKDKFDAAVKAIASLPSDGPFQPSNELKLKMYGCYKQATVGPCNVSRPSFWDVVNKAKWDAWSSLGTMDKDEAMRTYVEEIGKFVEMMPQNPAVRDLTEKLNVYEWVESGSTKSYGDSGVECNGHEDLRQRINATPEIKDEDDDDEEEEEEQVVLSSDIVTRAGVKPLNGPHLNGTNVPSSAFIGEKPNYLVNGRHSTAVDYNNDDDQEREDSSESPPPPSPLSSTLKLLEYDVYNKGGGGGPFPLNSVSAGLIPRVDSFHASPNGFNGSLLAGSTALSSGPIMNGDNEDDSGDNEDDNGDNEDDNNGVCDPEDGESRDGEYNAASEEITRETLMLLKKRASSELSSATEVEDNRDADVGTGASPVCPVFNSVVDASTGKLFNADSDDDDDDDDDVDEDEEFRDSSNEFSSPEGQNISIAAATNTTLTSETATPTTPNRPTVHVPPPPEEDYAPPQLVSPDRTISFCSTDSDVYATPALVTPEEGDDDGLMTDDCVEDAAIVLEREVKRLVDVSVLHTDRSTAASAKDLVVGRPSNNVNNGVAMEDLNFPLANEIRVSGRETVVKAEPKTKAVPTVAPVVRPKITANYGNVTKQTSPRSRRSATTSSKTKDGNDVGVISAPVHQHPMQQQRNPQQQQQQRHASEERDEVRVLSDIDDVALRPSRESLNPRVRQVSLTSRQEEEDSSSSDSTHSSSWSPTRRRRNFDDWPIRSGDDTFKRNKSAGRRHRDSDTTSAGGAGGGRGAGVVSNAGGGGGVARGRGGQSAPSSSRGRITSNVSASHSAGGAGGLPPPYPQPPIASAVNEQIAVALLRIQQDVSTLNARIHTLESMFWSSSSRNGAAGIQGGIAAGAHNFHAGDSGLTPPSPASAVKPIAETILNWLFPGFSLRSVVFLLLWPVLAKGAYLIVKALIGLAIMKRRRFIDGHDDLPPL